MPLVTSVRYTTGDINKLSTTLTYYEINRYITIVHIVINKIYYYDIQKFYFVASSS